MFVRRFVSLAVFLLLASAAQAQSRIEGIVRAVDGTPLGGSTVRIEAPDLKTPLTTTAGADGRFVFSDVKPGMRVQVVALHNGRRVAAVYTLVTLPVESINLQASPDLTTVTSLADLVPLDASAGDIVGVVRSADGSPVPAASVAINDGIVTTSTDSAGRFAFAKLRSGVPLELHVSARGFDPASAKTLVPNSGLSETDFSLQRARAAGSGPAELSVLDRTQNGSAVTVTPQQVAGVPSLGRNDIFRALQFLPSVAGDVESSSELFVRGGTPDQTLVTYDGFTIYPFRHVFGGFSAFDMNAVDAASFSESMVNAADGDRLSGALRLTGATATSRPRGSVELSALGWGTSVGVPIADRGSFSFTARRSLPSSFYDDWLDQITGNGSGPPRDRAARFSGGTFQTPSQSWFYDTNSRLALNVTPKDQVSVSFYQARDDLNDPRDFAMAPSTAVAVPTGVELPSDAVVQITQVNTWKGRGVSGTWKRQWSPAFGSLLSIGRSTFDATRDRSSLFTSPTTGLDYSFAGGGGGSEALANVNRVEDTTVRLDNSIRIGFAHFVSLGGEIGSLDTNASLQREIAQRSVANRMSSSLAPFFNQNASATLATLFAQDAWRPRQVPRLVVAPGARFTRYDLANASYVDPRVNAAYDLAPQVRATGAWSIDHQTANRITIEDRAHGDNEIWALADGTTIPIARVQQASVGVSGRLPTVQVDGQIFYKKFDDLSMFAPRLAPGAPVETGGRLVHFGSGEAKGLSLLVQHQIDRNGLWAGYTLSRVEYTYPTLEAATFPAPQDQLHELKAADTFHIARQWTVSGAWVVASGRPTTRATGVTPHWFPTGDSVNEITFAQKNADRLPAYHRLDLSTEMRVPLRSIAATFGATVFNVYDRENVSFRRYELAAGSLRSNDAILMRRALSVFLRVSFN